MENLAFVLFCTTIVAYLIPGISALLQTWGKAVLNTRSVEDGSFSDCLYYELTDLRFNFYRNVAVSFQKDPDPSEYTLVTINNIGGNFKVAADGPLRSCCEGSWNIICWWTFIPCWFSYIVESTKRRNKNRTTA